MNIKLLLSIVIYSSLHHFSIAQSPLPTNWHKTNNDSIRGVKSEEALALLKQSEIKPFGEIVVGIIDSGVDTTVVEIKKSLWTNKREKTMIIMVISTTCTDGTSSEPMMAISI